MRWLRATQPVTYLPDKGDRRPSTPHLEFSQHTTISITTIESVQPIVAIRKFEAGSSLDLNAHVDAVSPSGNRATACCAGDCDRNGISGSARRKPSTQQTVQAVGTSFVAAYCGPPRTHLFQLAKAQPAPREIHRQTQRRRHNQFLGPLSFFNSPVLAGHLVLLSR